MNRGMRWLRCVTLCFLLWSVCGARVLAGAPFVAIVAAATNSPITNERFTDLRDVLLDDGRFSGVDIISTTRFGSGTPTLKELLQYDAVIHWTNDSNEDSVALGNVMADYVDAGRGMVQAVFANTSTNPDRFLQGRWLDGPYNIIPPNGGFVQGPTPGAGATTETAIMDDPLEPDHPIFDGVGEVRLSTGQFMTGGLFGAWRPATTGIEQGSRKLALWEDGKTAVAVSDIFPNRVELGLHPVSDRVNDGYYDITSAAPHLIANALLYSAGALGVLVGDFNNDGILGCEDIDLLIVEIASGGNNLDFDISGDGQLDLADRDVWLAAAGATNLASGDSYILGDYNLDGDVDGLDYLVWNANKFRGTTGWCSADANADGVADGLDFLIWNANKFTSADARSVPEPSGGLLWLTVAIAGYGCRRRNA